MSFLEYQVKYVPTGLKKLLYVNWPLVVLVTASLGYCIARATPYTNGQNTTGYTRGLGLARELLLRAYGERGNRKAAATDDCMLVEAIGGKVRLIESDATNFKITLEPRSRRRSARPTRLSTSVPHDWKNTSPAPAAVAHR